jgi:hypothetical protein
VNTFFAAPECSALGRWSRRDRIGLHHSPVLAEPDKFQGSPALVTSGASALKWFEKRRLT